MKLKTISLTLILSALSLFSYELYGQERTEMSKQERDRLDSLQKVDIQVQEQQKADDKNAMDDAKSATIQTKAKAKEAQRVERDANAASVESKKALKMEKNAQKARKNADQQSQKASEARDKSDKN
jgi:hypothetical protein